LSKGVLNQRDNESFNKRKRKIPLNAESDEDEKEQQAERVDRHAIIQEAREEPEVTTNVLLQPIEPPGSELLERFHRFYKPGEAQTTGPLQLELNEMWKSGPGKTFFQLPNPVTKWQCHICFTSFLSKDALKGHLFDRYDINTYATHCPHCNCNFESDASLKHHTRQYHPHDKQVYPLEEIKKQNPPGRSVYPCVSCNSTFTLRYSYFIHYEKFHTGRKGARIQRDNYACTYDGCERMCPDQRTLSAHVGQAHGTGDRNAKFSDQQRDLHKFKCDYLDCNKVFMCKNSLKYHQYVNHAIN
jgi:hypothetical protein